MVYTPGVAATGANKEREKEKVKEKEKKEKEKEVDPWEVCGEFAKRYADEENASWKEEIDKLLIFVSFITIFIYIIFETHVPLH